MKSWDLFYLFNSHFLKFYLFLKITFVSFIFLFLTILGLHCFLEGFLELNQARSTLPGSGFSSLGAPALGQAGFSSCGTWAQLLVSSGNLPGPGAELPPPALLSIAPPGKSLEPIFKRFEVQGKYEWLLAGQKATEENLPASRLNTEPTMEKKKNRKPFKI